MSISEALAFVFDNSSPSAAAATNGRDVIGDAAPKLPRLGPIVRHAEDQLINHSLGHHHHEKEETASAGASTSHHHPTSAAERHGGGVGLLVSSADVRSQLKVEMFVLNHYLLLYVYITAKNVFLLKSNYFAS